MNDLFLEDDYKLFRDITLYEKPLKDCELVYQGKHDNTRLYISADNDHGFRAHAVEFVSCPVYKGINNQWDNKGLVVQTLFTVVAYYDGVRHLDFNRNGGVMDGYLYYPPMSDLLNMLQIVRELELKHCRDAE